MRTFAAYLLATCAALATAPTHAAPSTESDLRSSVQEAVDDATGGFKKRQVEAGALARAITATLAGNTKAVTDIQEMAARGHPGAINFIGWLLDHGKGGLPQDSYRAAQYFREAAIKGDVNALYNLGFMFYHGRGVTKDITTAQDLWKKATNRNSKYAAVQRGLEAERNKRFDDALAAFRAAALEQKHDYAIYRQGVLLYRGASPGSRPDPKTGLMLITRAANFWNPDAQAALIDIYANGLLVTASLTEAAKWADILKANPRRTRDLKSPSAESLGLSNKELSEVRDTVRLWMRFHALPDIKNVPDYSRTIY